MRRVLLLALLAWAATPAAASAHALMSTANGILRLTDGDTISRNTVSVTAEGKQARITDTTSDGGLGPGSAFDICIPITERELLCDVRKIRVIRIDVGSDDDTVTYRHPLPARIFGGGGHDVLRGGAGRDVIDGGDGPDRVEGGPGADAVGGGAGADEVFGDTGDDVLQGGAGIDSLLAATATTSCAPATAPPIRWTAAPAPTAWPPTTPTPPWAARPSSGRRPPPTAATCGCRARATRPTSASRSARRPPRASRCAAAGWCSR